MPDLFTVSGYKIYFWSNEEHEPIHVHVSKGVPTENSTKIWLTKSGGCIAANNKSRIPTNWMTGKLYEKPLARSNFPMLYFPLTGEKLLYVRSHPNSRFRHTLKDRVSRSDLEEYKKKLYLRRESL